MSDGAELELLLKIGAAGGSLSVWSINVEGGTSSFLVKENESALKGFMTKEDSSGITYERETCLLRSFEDALNVLGQYPWHLFVPMFVHHDFIEPVRNAVLERGGEEKANRWRRKIEKQKR